ncbi:MAG: DNA topoisomerase III [Verrucomicrobia bacterium]|nr:MAG: DNA topoisomerase III [Verrucomicrobiota bacterium]
MKTLIIAEKPSVAADISRALGRLSKNGDYYENDEYIVSSAVGHLVELAMPEDYDKKLGFWRLADLPIVPDTFKLKPIDKTKKRFQELKRLLARKDVTKVINACDAGREGELIFSYTYKLAKSKKPVERLWMSSMTLSGIREAFAHLRSSEEMHNLADAARCRSEADWLIGINCTRGATKRMFGSRAGNVAGVGRVQTPTLGVTMERERQIRAFVPRTYFRVVADFGVSAGTYEGTLQRPDYKKGDDNQDRVDRIWEKAQADAVAAALSAHTQATVEEEKKRSTQAPPRLYDLTTLQREANNRFGYPARRTLQIAQALYERHKMITYPRTDSKALPEDTLPTCREVLGSMQGDLAGHAAPVLENGWVKPNRRIFNNAQVSDHFAIIPTPENPKKLGEDEAKIFDMIARRFIAVFYPSAQFDVTTRLSRVEAHTFKTEGRVLVAPGYLSVYGRHTDDENGATLPAVGPEDGTPAVAAIKDHRIDQEETRPPPRYTEATLLSAMEGAGKLVDDEELAEAMKEKGLGTPATRAQVIERLIGEKYIERERRELVPTAKAERLFEFLSRIKAEALTRPDLTGEWEYKLRKIEHGELDGDDFIHEIATLAKDLIERIKAPEPDTPTDVVCPTDGKTMVENSTRYASQDGVFIVYKTIGGHLLTLDELKLLCADFKTGEIGADEVRARIGPVKFVSKRGKAYDACLIVNAEHKVRIEFDRSEGENGIQIPADAVPVGVCPKTGGSIFEMPVAWVVRVMEKEKETHPYRLSRRILAKETTLANFLQLLTDGKTELIKGFISNRTKRPFDAFLVLRKDGNVKFEFPPRPPRKKAATRKKAKKPPAKADAS